MALIGDWTVREKVSTIVCHFEDFRAHWHATKAGESCGPSDNHLYLEFIFLATRFGSSQRRILGTAGALLDSWQQIRSGSPAVQWAT